MINCSVFGCLSSYNDKGTKRSFYRYPLDETRYYSCTIWAVLSHKAISFRQPGVKRLKLKNRCRQWIRAAGRTDLENKDIKTLHVSYRICDLHFVLSDHKKKKLTQTAVPTINLPQLDTQCDKTTKCTQSDIPIPSTSTCTQTQNQTDTKTTQTLKVLSAKSPWKRKLQEQLKNQNKRIKMLENKLQSSEQSIAGLSPILQKIIYVQKNFKSKYKGNRYDREFKMFAMNIYFASPLAYRILAKTLYLPSERTLRRTKIDIGTKLSDNVISCLRSKMNKLSEPEKVCVLCVGEMPLKRQLHYLINKDKIIGFHEINNIQSKEPATQVFVVMARGLFSKWKQPLAYCFLSQSKNYPELCAWLDDIIIKVMDIGFKVVAFTSNQESNFVSIAKDKKVSSENSFFYVNGQKIYYIFDVPHLIKSLRNNLIKYDIIYQDCDGKEERASWEDVQNLYDMEKERSYQIAYKLTESHVRPNNIEKMKVKFAAQVFSRCVATAIQCCVEIKKIPEKALGTAKLLQLMNDMFDILNSSSCDEAYKYKKSFSQQEYQMEVLEKVLFLLKNVRVVQKTNGKDVTNSIKCLKCLEITIHSVINLSTDLKSQNFKYIFTQRLNAGVLENFFGSIRQQGGNCRDPTPVQFSAAFNNLFLTNIIWHSEYANCAEDQDKLLVAIEDTTNLMLNKVSEQESENVNMLAVGTVDYRFDLPEENAFSHLCGYLLIKCKEVHKNCIRLEEYVNNKGEINVSNTLINMKAYNTTKNFASLINPQENFKDFVRQMDEVVKNIFKGDGATLPPHVGNELFKSIDTIPCKDLPCECFPIDFLKKLFVRFRIFNIIKYNNDLFRNKSFRQKFLSISHL